VSHAGGRPCKLTSELAESVIEGVLSGLYLTQVALDNGVHPDTIRNWVRLGLEPEAREPYASFAQRFVQADIAVEKKVIRKIREGAEPHERKLRKTVTRTDTDGKEETEEVEQSQTEPGDWRAAAFFAERRWPKRWGAAKEGQSTGQDSLTLSEVLETAASRTGDLDELLSEPPPELEEALLRNKDKLLALLAEAPESKA
jgi:hypothetical protein